jgi:transposase-like protein
MLVVLFVMLVVLLVIDIESLSKVIDIESLFEVIDIEPLSKVIDIESLFEVIDIEPFKQKQQEIDDLNLTLSTAATKLTQWAEDNIPEGLTVFGLDLCEFNRKRLRASNMIERLNQSVKQRTKVAKIFANEDSLSLCFVLRLLTLFKQMLLNQYRQEVK